MPEFRRMRVMAKQVAKHNHAAVSVIRETARETFNSWRDCWTM